MSPETCLFSFASSNPSASSRKQFYIYDIPNVYFTSSFYTSPQNFIVSLMAVVKVAVILIFLLTSLTSKPGMQKTNSTMHVTICDLVIQLIIRTVLFWQSME